MILSLKMALRSISANKLRAALTMPGIIIGVMALVVLVSLVNGGGGLALFLVVSVLLARWAVKPVERAWEQQKQFVADASHELKTPLTVILTDTELLQSGACTEADKTRFLGSIRAMGEQMRGLVEELLSLTRPDKARSMNHSYGLWLAIARQIAESKKGKIWAESAGGINRFCVQLPAE